MPHAPLLSPSNLGRMFRLSVRLYFAPLIGAWHGALQETRRAHAQWDAALAGHADGDPHTRNSQD